MAPRIRLSRSWLALAAALALALLGLAGCATTRPLIRDRGSVGVASYYGASFHGRRTASGEAFDQRRLTAAHRTLPFDTRVRVTNLENGKQVVVRINDRGPVKRDRIIDLSYEAARQLGITQRGLARVRVRVLS
ncbi:MAG TPA: septal ring lytic transglycosylase RlpA family protein [Candidatus Limnocylindria bacterium]|nr:septal ring lytic transglycosylase RlpA family protein [Candidatus Limnocylindria bacterium]